MTDVLMEISHDGHAESSVLAACLISKPARLAARKHIGGNDFHDTRNKAIWDAMVDLDRAGRGVDPASVLSQLQTSAPQSATLLPNLVTWPAIAEHVEGYAETVREWSIRRQMWNATSSLRQKLANPETDVAGLSSKTVADFASIRDRGTVEDAQSITLGELLAQEDDEPDWLIPGLLERRDRFMLTGEEGLGKSYLLRQIAIMGAAGLDPFDPGVRIKPFSILIIDCENNAKQVKRKARPVVEFARRYGQGDPDRVNVLCSSRVDIVSDRDLARIHREIDACQPDLVVIGPLYRLTPRALQTDDEAAPVLAALDSIRDRDIAMLIEAHAGHSIGSGGNRNLRPRGSSALLGWPEFGYGMARLADGFADLVPWRGDRDERNWPDRMRRCNQRIRWVPVEGAFGNPIPEEAWSA